MPLVEGCKVGNSDGELDGIKLADGLCDGLILIDGDCDDCVVGKIVICNDDFAIFPMFFILLLALGGKPGWGAGTPFARIPVPLLLMFFFCFPKLLFIIIIIVEAPFSPFFCCAPFCPAPFRLNTFGKLPGAMVVVVII